MDPVGLHVVGEPRRAPDPADENDLLAGNAELRHERLERCQDRVVAAARAPTDFLVRLEVLGLQRGPDVTVRRHAVRLAHGHAGSYHLGMDLKRLFLAGLLVVAAGALIRALVTRHGVGPFEYATGALLVALLLRA